MSLIYILCDVSILFSLGELCIPHECGSQVVLVWLFYLPGKTSGPVRKATNVNLWNHLWYCGSLLAGPSGGMRSLSHGLELALPWHVCLLHGELAPVCSHCGVLRSCPDILVKCQYCKQKHYAYPVQGPLYNIIVDDHGDISGVVTLSFVSYYLFYMSLCVLLHNMEILLCILKFWYFTFTNATILWLLFCSLSSFIIFYTSICVAVNNMGN
jgi:hypothetical protein